MRLERYRATRFRHHLDVDLRFAAGLTAIVGPNGSGKTTLLEGMAWCLFGSDALLSGQTEVASNLGSGTTPRVELEFTTLGHAWRIVREVGAAAVFLDGRSVAEGANAVSEYVAGEIFGMTWKEWSTTLFAGQKSLDWLKGKRRLERERFLTDQLGYGIIKPAQRLSREEATRLKTVVATLEARAQDPMSLEVDILSQGARVAELLQAATESDVDLANVHKYMAQTDAALLEMDRAEAAHRQLVEQAREAQSRVSIAQANSRSARAELADAERSMRELDERRAELARCREAVARATADQIAAANALTGVGTGHDKDEADASQRLGVARERLRVAEAARHELGKLNEEPSCPKCGQTIDTHDYADWMAHAEDEVATAVEAKEKAEAALRDAMFVREQVERRLAMLRRAQSLADRELATCEARAAAADRTVKELGARAADYEQLKATADAVDAALVRLTTEAAEARKLASEHVYDAAAHKDLRQGRQYGVGRLQASQDENSKRHQAHTLALASLEALRGSQEANDRLLAEVRDGQARLAMVRATDRMFGELGEHLTQRIRPELSDRATALITEMSRGRFTSLRIDEDYEPQLVSSGRKIPLASGGEWDIANLALRLATSTMIGERSGRPLDVAWLDEPLAFVDADRTAAVVDSLRALTERRFSQIIIVTHRESVRDSVDHVIATSLAPDQSARLEVVR